MKVAIYCRLSEEDRNKRTPQDDSLSIENQKNMLKSYADDMGWELFDIYSDDDYAGADRKRPEFNRLLTDAEAHKFDIILCKTQSRFTRELELVERYINGLFPLWGIRFISIVDNADSESKGNKKSRQINGLVNEWYLEDMSENIKSVLDSRRKSGLHIGSFALYGYKKDPMRKGHLIIDDEAAEVVREIFTLFSKGYGKTAIARSLNDRRIPNPSEYKRLCGLKYMPPKSKISTLWKYSTIANILENEMYIGNMVQGKYGSVSYKTKQNKPRPKSEWYITYGTHEAIIEPELWNTVQKLREERTKPFSNGEIGLFAGKAKCAYCGYTLRSSENRGKHYLMCPNRHISKDACIGSFISVERLEGMVKAELQKLIESYLDVDELVKNISYPQNNKELKEKLLKKIEFHRKKAEEYSRLIKEVYIDKCNGIVAESDYIAMSKEFYAEREKEKVLLDSLNVELADFELSHDEEEAREALIKGYTSVEKLSRECVEILVDHIAVGKRIDGSRNVPVEIYWSF